MENELRKIQNLQRERNESADKIDGEERKRDLGYIWFEYGTYI